MRLFNKYNSLWIVILFGIGYAILGIWFPNPSNPSQTQQMWRLAAWVVGAIIFGIQIWYEHFRFHNKPLLVALHAAVSAALGAFGIAVAANIHSLYSASSKHLLLVLSLILWPIFVGVPAFVVAVIIALILERIKPIDKL